MKKLQSKKGLTLVELIITITILSMVAGMGVGVVANAMRNYAAAQTVAQEQDIALQVEDFILTSSRISSKAQEVQASTVPQKTMTGYYLLFDNDGTLKTVSHQIDPKKKDPAVSSTMKYDSVKQVSMSIRKQKAEKTDSYGYRVFVYLDYEIEMKEGYKLTGSTILNNADPQLLVQVKADSYQDIGSTFTIQNDNASNALAIIK